MKEHPILFSTPMVTAILQGRKTMTRRIIDPQPESGKYPLSELDGFYWKNKFYLPKYERKDISLVDNSKFGQPGDLLWVRESFSFYLDAILYKADEPHVFKNVKYKPSIFMRKNYSRIWLQIEEIRAERLQDISEEDAINEGIERIGGNAYKMYSDCFSQYPKPKDDGVRVSFSSRYSFATLWAKINGPESWIQNPYVWVVKFKVLSTTGKPITETHP
jgi:hypothetical protein